MKKPPSSLSKDEFVAVFGRVYELSPWVAERVWSLGLDARCDTVVGLHEAMRSVVEAAAHDQKRTLLNLHPDLASKIAVAGGLTAESTGEQASAGLDKCTPEEFAKFNVLNSAYRSRFGFPFIMAVRGRQRSEILAAFEQRVGNTLDVEFKTALAEVHKIAWLRLVDLFPASSPG